MKLTTRLLLPAMAAVMLFACDKGGKEGSADFKTSESGLQYKIIRAGESEPDTSKLPKEGQIMQVNMEYRNGNDSLFFTTFGKSSPLMVPVFPSTFKGSLEEGMGMLAVGDSGIFKINADSFFVKTVRQPMPPYIKPGSFMTITVKLLKLMNQEEAQAEQQRMFEQQQKDMMAHAEEQSKEDEAIIKNYIEQKGLQAQRTASGLYYVITKPGTGPNAKAGQMVKVHYTGTTLDGTKFDSSLDRGEPIEFPLGQGQVIPGWDEGLALLNKGAKATLIIPSPLAYGQQERGEVIKANSILLFDVELVDISNQ